MDEILQTLALRPQPWTGGEIVLNISLAFLLGLFITWVYRSTQRTLQVSFSFVNTLVILAMLMTLVMMVIGNNVARAFGLAGAMSIIRFRTVVKDTRDTAFVFFALASGMACGTGNLKISVIGTMLVGLYLGILHWTKHGSFVRNEYLLTFRMYPTDNYHESRVYESIFKKYLKRHHLVSIKSTRMGDMLLLSFYVVVKDPSSVEVIVSELGALEGVERVNFSFGEEIQG